MSAHAIVRARGDLSSLDADTLRIIRDRGGQDSRSVRDRTAAIIANVATIAIVSASQSKTSASLPMIGNP